MHRMSSKHVQWQCNKCSGILEAHRQLAIILWKVKIISVVSLLNTDDSDGPFTSCSWHKMAEKIANDGCKFQSVPSTVESESSSRL